MSYTNSKYFIRLGEELLKSARSSWPVIEITDKSGKRRKVRVNPAKLQQQEEKPKPQTKKKKEVSQRAEARRTLHAAKAAKDEELVKTILGKDKVEAAKAQATLYTKYKADAFKIINTFVRDAETANDLVADNFVKVFAKLNSYAKDMDKLAFKSWFVRVTSNSARDYLRSAQAAFKKNAISEEQKKTRFASMAATETPEQAMESKQMAEHIKSALSKLPEEYSSAIKDYYFGGLTTKEIAKKYNISVSGVQQRLIRGKNALRSSLSPDLYKALQLQFAAIETLSDVE